MKFIHRRSKNVLSETQHMIGENMLEKL